MGPVYMARTKTTALAFETPLLLPLHLTHPQSHHPIPFDPSRLTSLKASAASATWLGTGDSIPLITFHFLAALHYITDDGVVDFGLEERSLTPSFDEGTSNDSGDDDAYN
ncbi:hypothetical protein Syun_028239 [Stephania yunnanensis]|uniref:Uncharacterized protein n=1 Tax=Stephania yunnanensis TaxID=152371 RepID=A0AAP0HLQ8_9MAGN